MEVGIDKIFEYLSWDSNNEIQKRGIELASNINNLSVLIMPIENKSIWENCAKVLISKCDEELELYFFELFEWLKDMNWPGAYLIYDRLICVSTEKFLPAYQYSLSVAKQMDDRIWEMVLKEEEKNWNLDSAIFEVVLKCGIGFFGRRREENVSFLKKQLEELERLQISQKQRDTKSISARRAVSGFRAENPSCKPILPASFLRFALTIAW